MLTQGQVEAELERLSALLEARTDEYTKAVVAAAEAENVYLKRHDTLVIHEANSAALQGRQVTVSEREARVRLQSADELATFKIKEAQAEGIKQALYSLRAQLNALQTISANIRAQT